MLLLQSGHGDRMVPTSAAGARGKHPCGMRRFGEQLSNFQKFRWHNQPAN
jgi:hypothetical protein